MLNRVILIGRLTRDPELRQSTSGIPVCNLTLAVNRSYSNAAGERVTDFIDVITWRQLAENCGKYLTKGRLIAMEGRLQVRTYETQEGQKRKVMEVIAESIKFLERSPHSSADRDDIETFEIAEGITDLEDTTENAM